MFLHRAFQITNSKVIFLFGSIYAPFYGPHCMVHLVLAISYGPYDLASSDTKSKNDDSKHELSENFHQKIIKASCFCRQGTKIEQCSMFDYRLGYY